MTPQQAGPAAGRTATSSQSGHGFGTAPVFLASISTILGAILFLRFGYAVAHVGLWGSLVIIVIALYLSQAISVAFYLVAFAEAFDPVYKWAAATYAVDADPRWVSFPCTVLLAVLILTKGADLGVRALWIVSAILGASIWRRRTRNAEALQFDDGGRLPISKQNVTSVPCTTREALEFEVSLRSSKADLVIAGLTDDEIKSGEVEQTLQCYDRANDVLFVNASEPVLIE